MTITDEILIIANKIANNGNKPTVALIKTKLKSKVALPVLISTLKTWQHEPDFVSLPEEHQQTTPEYQANTTTETSSNVIHEELADLKKEVIALKKLIAQLISQQS
ncbi:hypothetical protein NBRC116592_28650 [Colwellia sp. KU-HH00111]|uniref:hypothetical protein n=1 Tax=Colwellia sp. KU-HH00111 TaxID=3127652 RepID=UPI003107BF42